MPNRCCILQQVFKELREIIRDGPLEGYIRGFCFESRRSKTNPVKIRWRICHPNNQLRQAGNPVYRECWNIAKHDEFSKKFKEFLKLLKMVKSTLFEFWKTEDFENLMKRSEALAREKQNITIGAHFLFKAF